MRLSRRNFLSLAAAALTALVISATPRDAHAQNVGVTVTVIVGAGSGGIDSSLSSMSSQLQRRFPQFSAFSQHARQSLSLTPGRSASVSIPGGGTAALELLDSSGGTHRIRVTVPGGGTTITTSGGRMFVGGARVPGGTLILAIDT